MQKYTFPKLPSHVLPEQATYFFCIRHGETDWNTARRIQGHTDIPLNANGISQAHICAQALQQMPLFDALVSSDLQRAQHTANIIAEHLTLTPQIDPELRERHYGVLEGLTEVEIATQHPIYHRQWQNRDPTARFTSTQPTTEIITAESLLMLQNRAVNVISHLATIYPKQRVLLITHGGFIDSLIRYARGMSLSQSKQYEITNTSIHLLTWQGTQLRHHPLP